MTTTPARSALRRLEPADVPAVVALLEDGPPPPGARVPDGVLAHQFLLDALDRGEHHRVVVWPADDPVGVLYAGPTGTLVPAGAPAAAAALADAAERTGWRVLVGDAAIGWALLDAAPRGLFRRRATAREQRFMAVRAEDAGTAGPAVAGFRLATPADLDVLVEFACRLHVEDRMGAPIAKSARASVRTRMLESVGRGATWVVERDGRPVAKADLSLRSPRRGGQIAGVYVDHRVRGQGVASGLVAAIVRLLVREGLPAVSLHVRADNLPAIAAYRRAGLVDRGPWVLALR